ncbi:cyclase family protein [bacterium]|nr:cyclase family protein [bacterium]MBU1071650.1 cyclase family protein [bacterium]MBU1675385.1 cyclase family protein [bacterium]
MKAIDLSHTLFAGMDVYPGDETVPAIDRLSDHGDGQHRSSAFGMGCHTGTHIDLPLHFKAGEPALESFPLEGCFGRARVFAAPPGRITAAALDGADLSGLDFVLLRTGWERHWGTPRYYRDWPWLDPGLADLLAGAGLRGVGLDSPSVDPLGARASHERLAAAGLVNVENLANLDRLPDEGFLFAALPLRLEGAEASPVRAVALI